MQRPLRRYASGSITSLLPSQPEPIYKRNQPLPNKRLAIANSIEVSQPSMPRLNQPLLEPNGTNTPTEHVECSQPPPVENIQDTAFRGFYVAVGCLKRLDMDHSATLKMICQEHFRKLPEDQKHLFFLVTSYFCTNAMPSYQRLWADFQILIYDSMTEPSFPWSLDPFEAMLRKGSELQLSVGETANELRDRWIQLMVLQSKVRCLQS